MTIGTYRRRFSHYQFLLTVLFTLFLLLPVSGFILNESAETSLAEKRKLSTFPVLSLQAESLKVFPKKFEKFVEDHFGYRNKFIYLHNLIKIRLFKKTTVSSVAIGKEGWLFWAKAKIFEDYRGKNPFKNSELSAWKTVLENRQQWLSERGIQYFFLIPPNKHTIYSEYLPEYISQHKSETRLDQFVTYFEKNSSVPVIDLRSPLFEAKQTDQIYYKTDMHWNFKGGYIGYKNIIYHLQHDYPTLSVVSKENILERKAKKIGDLAQYMGLDKYFTENIPVIFVKHACAKEIPFSIPNLNISRYFSSGCQTKDKVAVVFRDSFFNYVVPFFSESFKQVVYVWHGYNHNTMKVILKTVKPDIVIEERLQRYLASSPPTENGEMNQGVDYSRLTHRIRLLQLNTSNGFQRITANEQARMKMSSDVLKITATDTDPSLFLPKFINATEKDRVIIRISLSSPGDTVMQLFFKTHNEPYFSEHNSISRPIVNGENDIYIQTSIRDLTGELRLDPGALVGEYSLREFSIHTIQWL